MNLLYVLMMFPENSGEHLAHMSNMFLIGFRKDQNVIQIHKHTDIEHITEHIVNQTLKHSRSIGESKRHDKVFIMATRGIEGYFPLISFLDAYGGMHS